jgi:hypothetical protein
VTCETTTSCGPGCTSVTTTTVTCGSGSKGGGGVQDPTP